MTVRRITHGLAVVAALAGAPASAAELPPAERAAVFKAAAFKPRGSQFVRCEEEPPTASYVPGQIELADLNGDGKPEAWVTESSVFCYGNTGSAFLLTKDADGTWRKLFDAVGVATALETKQQGWPDIEVGGPGFGKFPVYRWNGKTYAARK